MLSDLLSTFNLEPFIPRVWLDLVPLVPITLTSLATSASGYPRTMSTTELASVSTPPPPYALLLDPDLLVPEWVSVVNKSKPFERLTSIFCSRTPRSAH